MRLVRRPAVWMNQTIYTNTIKSTKTLYDIFQAHMNIQTKDGIKEITYYITHDKSPEQWVRDNNILENSYYKTEEGYKNVYKPYTNE